MQSSVPRRVQSNEPHAPSSTVKRTACPRECSQEYSVPHGVQSRVQRVPSSAVKRSVWSVDGGIRRRRDRVILPAIVAQSGQRIVLKEAIGVLMFTDA